MKKPVALLVLLLAAPPTAPALAQAANGVSECDRLAAFPFDPNHPDGISGVQFYELEPDLAVPACERALEQLPDNPRYQYQLARSLIKAKRYSKALKFLRLAAEQSYAPAQRSIGIMYQRSQGVPQSDAEAVKWFRQAAEQGYAPAQNNLGSLYEKGRSVAQDDAAALKWYRKSAEQGRAG